MFSAPQSAFNNTEKNRDELGIGNVPKIPSNVCLRSNQQTGMLSRLGHSGHNNREYNYPRLLPGALPRGPIEEIHTKAALVFMVVS